MQIRVLRFLLLTVYGLETFDRILELMDAEETVFLNHCRKYNLENYSMVIQKRARSMSSFFFIEIYDVIPAGIIRFSSRD